MQVVFALSDDNSGGGSAIPVSDQGLDSRSFSSTLIHLPWSFLITEFNHKVRLRIEVAEARNKQTTMTAKETSAILDGDVLVPDIHISPRMISAVLFKRNVDLRFADCKKHSINISFLICTIVEHNKLKIVQTKMEKC